MTQNLAEKSYKHIRGMLSRGDLLPGTQLVNRTLAKEIGVSVIPVREAIHRLSTEGLIEHVPGAGAFVKTPTLQDIDDLYVLREALESCVAGEAARHIGDTELEELTDLISKSRQVFGERTDDHNGYATTEQHLDWMENQTKFHTLLIESSRNPRLAKVAREQLAISQIFDVQRNQNPSPQLEIQVFRDFDNGKQKLLESLRNGDGNEARLIMSRQIRLGRSIVLRFFRERSE